MVNLNNQCDYAIYAEVKPFVESNNYIGYNLPLSTYFGYYPDNVEYSQVDTLGSSSAFIHYPFSFSQHTLQDEYYRAKILPLFPEGWQDKMPVTTTYHLIYSRDLFNNNDYYNEKIYGCVYIQFVGNGNYERLDKYLDLNIAPVVPNSNEDIFFLYNLGQSIMNNSVVDSLLSLDINGVSFFNMLFGGGFIVFATWCIIKWIIPL